MKFTQDIYGSPATFRLSIDGAARAIWAVEFLGVTDEFTYEEWIERGARWAGGVRRRAHESSLP